MEWVEVQVRPEEMQFLFHLCHLTSWKVFFVLCLFMNVLFMAVCATGRALQLLGKEAVLLAGAAGAFPIKMCSEGQRSPAQPCSALTVQNSPGTALGSEDWV